MLWLQLSAVPLLTPFLRVERFRPTCSMVRRPSQGEGKWLLTRVHSDDMDPSLRSGFQKYEGPQILSNLRATSDAGPISRILYSVAAVMVIPLGRPSLDGSSDLPGSMAPRAKTHPGRCHPGFLPYLVLLRVGFTMPRSLLAGRCALTAPFHPYPAKRGGMFSVALSVERPCKTPRHVKRVSGAPRRRPPGRYPAHCSAEFGLSSLVAAQPRKNASVRGKTATIRSGISSLHYRMVGPRGR